MLAQASYSSDVKALWRPGWYELDAGMFVGEEDEFPFCASLPATAGPGFDVAFHTVLLDPSEPVMRRTRISRIRHPSLGEVRRVDTKGLSYLLELADGAVLRVEAEETPGAIDWTSLDPRPVVECWDLEVEIEFIA